MQRADLWQMTATGGPRIDWKSERERIDLAAVATALLGPAPGRRGERSRKLWWCCPFHDDVNPSFCIEPGKTWWKCFGCGEKGDAANLAMRIKSVSFPEALSYLSGGSMPSARATMRPAKVKVDQAKQAKSEPSGMSESDALALVESSEARLWTPEGEGDLAYLTGPERCLSLQAIRTARLGSTSWVKVPKANGEAFRALGIVIPWFHGNRLAIVKIRQPSDRRPKYAEVYRDPARLVCYPGPETIRPGKPLVIVEGEFDTLVLSEALGERAAVVTLGSAAVRRDPSIDRNLRRAPRWYIATDGDSAGEKAATDWPARARRIRPPHPHKDWSEAKVAGVNLSRWWGDILNGNDRPALYTWEELSKWRWGSEVDDDTPGIMID
jgi:DNA primase